MKKVKHSPIKLGSVTAAGPGVDVSAAICPRLTVGVQGRCSKPATIFVYCKKCGVCICIYEILFCKESLKVNNLNNS